MALVGDLQTATTSGASRDALARARPLRRQARFLQGQIALRGAR